MVSYQEILSHKNKKIETNDTLDSVFKTISSDIEKATGIIENNNKINNWRAEKPTFLKKTELNKTDICKSDINIHLNKLSPKNFDEVSNKILSIILKNREFLSYTLENLFLKAVEQPVYCPYYVKFVNIMNESDFDLIEIIKEKCNKFKYILIENTSSSKVTTSDNYDDFCKHLKDKSYRMGYSQFLGELFNIQLITQDILNENIEICIENISAFLKIEPKGNTVDDNITCLTKILKTVENKNVTNQFNNDLIIIKNNKLLPMRLKFMIMDIL